MKKKITTLLLAGSLVAMTLAGASLAYFTDQDEATNTFTVGSVAIDLHEANKDTMPLVDEAYHTWLEDQVLMPGDNQTNTVAKRVYVENTGKSDAFVRVHIAIPSVLDDPQNASYNLLHFNYAADSIGTGKWDWSKTTGAPHDGDWNYYVTTIGGISYNVYVVTYEGVLTPDTETEDAIHQVYLYKDVTNEDIKAADVTLKGKWDVLVFAEGVQEAGFTNAYEAFEASFGSPTEASNPWNNYGEVTPAL